MAYSNNFLFPDNCFCIKDTTSNFFIETVNLQDNIRNDLVLIKEIPYSYSLKTFSLRVKNHLIYNYDINFFVILLCTIILTLSKVMYTKKTIQIIKSFFVPRHFNILLRETEMFRDRIIFLQFTNFILATSFFIYLHYFKDYNVSLSKSIITLVLNNILFIAVCTFKFIFISFTGITFKTIDKSREITLLNLLFCNISGIILWISLFFLCYSKILYVFEFVTVIMVILYIFMMIKEFFIIIRQIKFSRFYIIVYFCTLEILPIILFVIFFNTKGILFFINIIYKI